jgi:outer membrane protein assembly factor BamB
MTVVQLAASQDYVAAALYAGDPDSSRQGLVRVYGAQTGRLLWEKELRSSGRHLTFDPLGAERDRIYLLVPAKEEKLADLLALEAATGKEVWRHTNLDVFSGPVAGVGDFVLADNGQGTLYVLERKSGVLLGKLSIEGESQ